MPKISTIATVPVPKLSDKLVGTSVGGSPNNQTNNFTLQQLKNLFDGSTPSAATLQSVLNAGNTATQSIFLTGTIEATNLDILNDSNLTNIYLSDRFYDRNNSQGTSGQYLTSTGTGVQWATLTLATPTLQQVLTAGNVSDRDITTTGNLQANNITGTNLIANSNLRILGTLADSSNLVGTSGQVLSSTVSGTSWINLPSYSAASPLLYSSLLNQFSIQQATSSQNGYLSSADWLTFDGKQNAGNYITQLTGEASASGPGSATITLNNISVINKILTGLTVSGGTINSSDSILSAFGKLQNQINGVVTGLDYQGTWNAALNIPNLVSGIGTNGDYYVVDVAGGTNLDGITDWNVGDWAIFNGNIWQKLDNSESVSSVNGLTGAVVLTTTNIAEGTNLYFTQGRVSANADVSANTFARHNAVTLGTANGLSLATQQLSLALASSSTTGALSSTDWTTFNNKQNEIINPITGTLATGQVAFGTAANTIGGDAGFTWNNTTKILDFNGLSTFPKITFRASNLTTSTSEIGRRGSSVLYLAQISNVPIEFDTNNTLRWSILNSGILQSNGAQTIQTSTGNLTLATAAGNGNILLTPNGTGVVSTLNNVGIGVSTLLAGSGPIITTTLTSGGSGYVDGTYVDVASTAIVASGVLALFTIVVSGGIVTTATLTWAGVAYRVDDTITVSNTLLGGTGSGLVITVNTVDSSQLTIAGVEGGDITLYRNDSSLVTGENIGTIKWQNRDSSLKASGTSAEIGAFGVGAGGGAQLSFFTSNGSGSALTERWSILSTGILQSNGAQTIQTSTGNLTLTSADNTGIVDVRRNDRALGAELRLTNSANSSSWIAGDIVGTLNFVSSDTTTTQPIRSQIQAISLAGASYPSGMNLTFSTANGNTLTEGFRLTALSNVLIGTTTDAGQRLQVTGTTFLNGQQILQGITASDTAPLGPELATTGTGTNWTGTDFATGYTHVVGSTASLTTTLAAVIGTYYQITYTVTGRTAGTFTINYGGTSTVGLTGTGNTGPVATTTATLEIVPTTDFNGTIVLSVKTISNSSATTVFRSSAGSTTNEIRVSDNSNNCFVGLNAGRRNTTGVNNAFFGNNSGINNTTGSNNTFVGRGAGFANSIGASNSFFGLSTGIANTTGSNNSFFGRETGNSNTTGANNSFFGVNAGSSNTVGNQNTFVGNDSAATLNTGSNNLMIGMRAGRYLANGITALAIADNSVFLGFDTRANGDSQTNQIVIGHTAIGLGSNTTVIGNSSTTFGRWFGNLLIGSSNNLGHQLQVTGTSVFTGDLLIGTSTNIASSLLTMASTTQGFLPPRMTSAQRTTIASPAEGLLVIQTDGVQGLYIYINATWRAVAMV